MDLLIYALIIFVCLLLSAFFSGSETALMRLRREHLEKDIQAAKGPAALAVRNLLDSTSRLLITILLGNNLANIVAAAVASALAISLFGEKRGILIASIVMTAVILIFAEILPKAMAARAPKSISYKVGLPLYFIHQLLRPIHFIFDFVIDPVVRKLTHGAVDTRISRTEELLDLARHVPQKPEEKGSPIPIITAAAEAAETTVEEIMVPRAEIVSFPIKTPASELLDLLMEERYTRAPVYEESLDKILGLIHLKDLIELVRGQRTDIREIIKPVLRVPELKPILQLLADMQHGFIHMAIVKDEHGLTMGLVTQEDILEELVGEIRDEFDRDELYSIRALSVTSYEALGRLKVIDFNRQTGWDVDTEHGDTLSGLVFNTLGRAPHIRDLIDVGGYRITVLDVSGIRITRVRVAQLQSES